MWRQWMLAAQKQWILIAVKAVVRRLESIAQACRNSFAAGVRFVRAACIFLHKILLSGCSL
jgi:hypothetical protein